MLVYQPLSLSFSPSLSRSPSLSGVSKMTVARTVGIVKSIMTASSDSEVSVVIHLRYGKAKGAS